MVHTVYLYLPDGEGGPSVISYICYHFFCYSTGTVQKDLRVGQQPYQTYEPFSLSTP